MQKYRPGEVVPMSCNYKAYDKDGNDGGMSRSDMKSW